MEILEPTYDPNLKDKINGVNTDNSPILNDKFSSLEEHITFCLRDRKGGSYENLQADKLLLMAEEHIEEHKSAEDSENILFLTHPLYLSLTHFNFINSPNRLKEYSSYVNTFFKLLNNKTSKKNLKIIALETLHHYAAATSLLLEQGLIDDVILTEYDDGTPLNKDVFDKFLFNNLFVGGGYNSREGNKCLASSIAFMKHSGVDLTKTSFVKDLIINSPLDTYSLKPHDIRYFRSKISLNDKRVITAEQMLEKVEHLFLKTDEIYKSPSYFPYQFA